MHRVAIDTETARIAPGRVAPPLACVTICVDGSIPVILDPDEGLDSVWARLTQEHNKIVGHNIAFDLAVLASHVSDNARLEFLQDVFDAYDEGRIVCTMVREQLRKIALGRFDFDHVRNTKPGFTLAALAEEYLGEKFEGKDGDDVWRRNYRKLIGVPVADWPADAREYALHDAEITSRVEAAQRRECEAGDTWPDEERQFRAAWALQLMGCWGFRTDGEATQKLAIGYRRKWRLLTEDLIGLGLLKKDGSRDLKVIRERVELAYDGAPPLTDSGAISTARDTLESAGDEQLEVLASRGKVEKYLSTYIPNLAAGADCAITPRWNTLVATGRTSGPWQQLPRSGGIRECVVPREGHVFVLFDYATAELRALAQVLVALFGESEMATALRDGKDLHLVTAAQILGVSYEFASRGYEVSLPRVKDARQMAKAANFGFPGGLGVTSFVDFAAAAYGLQLTEQRARELKEAWFAAYPEVRGYFDVIAERCEQGGGSMTVEHLRSGRLRGGARFTQASNSHFQGLVADLAKEALYRVQVECYSKTKSPLYGCRPVLFVHDEIDMEAPIDRAPAAAERLREICLETAREWCPDVPWEGDVALADRLSKDAAEVRNDDGELVVWSEAA